MAELPRNLVVRPHAPGRRRVVIGTLAALALIALYFAYEFGRYDAGYDRLAVTRDRREFEVIVETLDKSNRELRTKLAALETIRIGRNRERAEVARTISDLQAQIARLTQELAFYRGIVTQGANTLGVRIQELRIAATEQPERFRVRINLQQNVRPDEALSGTFVLKVEGESQGNKASLDFAALTQGKLQEQPFNFRYYENFDQEILIPAGFRPERLTVEVRSSRKGVTPLRQSFLWRVDAS
jgi:hypothetical protein